MPSAQHSTEFSFPRLWLPSLLSVSSVCVSCEYSVPPLSQPCRGPGLGTRLRLGHSLAAGVPRAGAGGAGASPALLRKFSSCFSVGSSVGTRLFKTLPITSVLTTPWASLGTDGTLKSLYVNPGSAPRFRVRRGTWRLHWPPNFLQPGGFSLSFQGAGGESRGQNRAWEQGEWVKSLGPITQRPALFSVRPLKPGTWSDSP